MTRSITVDKFALPSAKTLKYGLLLRAFFSGLLLPLGFAPFHMPWAAIIGLALFYSQLKQGLRRHAFLNGLLFGFGFFGLGVSWVFVSIHEYGHLNRFVSALITLCFIFYLALFPAFMSFVFKILAKKDSKIMPCLLFSSLWILFEYLRSTFLSGFPWLQLGFGQFDTPSKYLLPIVGVYGVGFLTCFAATLLSCCVIEKPRRLSFITALSFILLFPLAFKSVEWSKESTHPLSVGVIQANLSMRDKWDENLFWQLLERYKKDTEKLFGTQLIVMPESAIPLPPSYILDVLMDLDSQAKEAGSAVMLGIPTPTTVDENYYYNALITLGQAKGSYQKQHLVPFGEYIPEPFQAINNWLTLPDTNLKPGKKNQTLVKVQQYAIATLICYELAYSDLLRNQLPNAQWIVSISDAGWFGHSLAMYQQLQMAQARSVETARYQVVANNDGLSSIINRQGEITSILPAFSAGILKAKLFPSTGMTPWVYWGNTPILLFCALVVLFYTGYRIIKQNVK